ncbi:MAG: hypothetical protein IKN17_09890 [Ruminococcus sp.]|nr:hypothetical protein [Ruminococcus sp.]
MFLNRLSNEQKELFLDLCIHASKANNNFSAEEKLTVEQYCEEMHIDVRFDEREGFAEATDRLIASSSDQELKIILLETAALLLSDSTYDPDEQRFFDSLTARLGLAPEQTEEVLTLLSELTGVYSKINDFIFG